MKINDRVITRKIGEPAIGRISCVFTGSRFKKISGQVDSFWDKYYPDWETKLVYGVEFSEEIKTLSYSEVLDIYKGDKNLAKKIIDILPSYNFFYYPEDDLELFE